MNNNLDNNFEIIILIIFIPLFNFIISKIKDYDIIDFFNFYSTNKFINCIKIIGIESLTNHTYFYDYPYSMLALNHSLINEYKFSNITMCNLENNGCYYPDEQVNSNDYDSFESCYILNDIELTKLDNDIYVKIYRLKNNITKNTRNEDCKNQAVDQIYLELYSNVTDLKTFVNNKIQMYDKYCKAKNNNNIYHFIYQGCDNDKLKFTDYVLSTKDENKSSESFDHIFNEHKNAIIEDLNLLNDINYYKKRGMRRKKGYLFYGNPGCGKTATVIAMSLHDNRHIIEIPFSRIKTNKEFEKLINISSINNISFKKSEVIIFFDEIDIKAKILDNRDEPVIIKDENETKNDALAILSNLALSATKNGNNEDEINLGIFLSRLDGIGNYDGLIFVATTNHINKLDPALYRELRLNPYYFDYIRKIDIINMIEKYCNIKLSEKQKNMLPDRKDKISPAKMKFLIEKYSDFDKLITNLN